MSENQLPPIGNYKARRYEAISAYEAKTGSLCVTIPSELIDSGYKLQHTLVLYKADGTAMQGNIDTLATVFPNWQVNEFGELNPFDLAEIPLNDGKPEFMLADCYHEEYNGKMKFKAQWFNPLPKETSDEDKKALQLKWSAKFKQAATIVKSKQPSKPAAQSVQSEPIQTEIVAEKPVTAKPARKAPVSKPTYATTDDLYAALKSKYSDKSDDEIAEKYWYPACDELFGKDNQPETPEQIAQLAVKLGL